MNFYGDPITKLIEKFASLPGIGRKSAQRLAFYVIVMDERDVPELADAILSAKRDVKYCSVCCNLTDGDICPICSSARRDKKTIMVVENPRDLAAYERTKEYNGVYHVLHGAISPMSGITPSDIKLKELLQRIQNNTCHKPHRGGRGNGNVYKQAHKTTWHKGNKDSKRRTRWRRPGICRPGDPCQGA